MHASAVGGGCINRGYRLQGIGGEYFVKLNRPTSLPMFEAEVEGLREIAATGTVRVPHPVCTGSDHTQAWIVLEYLALGSAPHSAMARLGEQLAALHRVTSAYCGWTRDNTIGSTPQVNTQTADWIEFWRRHRLGFQLDLAARNGHGGALQRDGAKLIERLPEFFAGYRPAVSLLHGDLWGGNASATIDGTPVLFDPATYYGDREADLAMTELFGGFPRGFYDAYTAAWPLDPNYRRRRGLYNLYHVLNHLNLFGGGYRTQAEGLIRQLLA